MIITFVLLVNESETSVGEAEQILKDLIDTNSLGLTDLNGDPLTVDSSSYKAVVNKALHEKNSVMNWAPEQ